MYEAVVDKKLESGMDSVAAYESLGFDTKVMGVNRAYQAAKHAREKATANKLYTVEPGSYNGSLPPEETFQMADPSKDELIAYLKVGNYYMEELVEAQKTCSVLEDIWKTGSFSLAGRTGNTLPEVPCARSQPIPRAAVHESLCDGSNWDPSGLSCGRPASKPRPALPNLN